jgi:hypothetical protein
MSMILGFIFGAAIGTGLAVSYRKELASCETFVDLNIYLQHLSFDSSGDTE